MASHDGFGHQSRYHSVMGGRKMLAHIIIIDSICHGKRLRLEAQH
jgi:hypothetical protein